MLRQMQNHAKDLSCLTAAGLAWHNIACDIACNRHQQASRNSVVTEQQQGSSSAPMQGADSNPADIKQDLLSEDTFTGEMQT